MQINDVIETSIAVNASTLGSAYASAIIRDQYDGSIKVHETLKPAAVSYLKSTATVSLIFTNSKLIESDHPVLAALRSIVREIFEKLHHLRVTDVKTLVVGSASREMRLYYTNPNIHHWIYGEEGKDYTRIILPVLEDISKNVLKKAKLRKTKDMRIHVSKPENYIVGKDDIQKRILKRYEDIQSMLKDYVRLNKLPSNFHVGKEFRDLMFDLNQIRKKTNDDGEFRKYVDTGNTYVTEPYILHLMEKHKKVEIDIGRFEVLVFEDSIYNYNEQSLCELFEITGANVAYGYGLFPYELIYDNMPENDVYRFLKNIPIASYNLNVDKNNILNEYSILTFHSGQSNGYSHRTSDWSTLLQKPILKNGRIALTVEFTSRVGCMASFKIYKCRNSEVVVRTIELPLDLQYVRLLDLFASVNIRTGKINYPLKYFSVYAKEYEETLLYALSLDPKSLTFTNLMSYVRRRLSSISIAKKELMERLRIPEHDSYRFVMAILIDATIKGQKADLVMKNVNPTSVYEKFMRLFRTAVHYMAYPISVIVDYILEENLTNKIAIYNESFVLNQFAHINLKVEEKFEAKLAPVEIEPENFISCPFCYSLDGKLGEQILNCEYKENCYHEFSLDRDELNRLRTSLADTDNDPVGLASVKKQAKDSMPIMPFSHKCKISYIAGGPGTGKSQLIRLIADEKDLILAPFTKLMSDYTGVEIDEKGTIGNFVFKTQHRAMSERGHKRIIVDEMTSMPYEYIACVAYLNGAEEVILVGDTKQTKTKDPEEGIYVGNKIDFENVCKHELLVNFRNPKDIVYLLNKEFGYSMIPKSDIETSINIIGIDEISKISETSYLTMCFSNEEQNMYCADIPKATVRSNQGGTTNIAFLYATQHAGRLTSVSELQIVAISRHREKLYIVHDSSDSAKTLLVKLGCTTEFMEHIGFCFRLPDRNIMEQKEIEDPALDLILPKIHPPRDAYLLAEMNFDPVTQVDNLSSQNEYHSHIVNSGFKTMVTHLDDIVGPINIRGHPQVMQKTVYAFSNGDGRHYTSHDPYQELAVIRDRYDNAEVKSLVFDEKAKEFAHNLVELYFAENKDLTLLSTVNDEDLEKIAQQFVSDAIKKNYHKQYRGMDNPDINVVRFHLKQIFKPATTTKQEDLLKAGQGISAWNVDLQSKFCMLFRIMKYIDIKTDRNDDFVANVTDHGLSEIEFSQLISESYSRVLKNISPVINSIIDVEKMDAGQNQFTMEIEKYYWKKLGINENLLEEYYVYRSEYTIIGDTGKARVKFVKASGEPGTLANNEKVSVVLTNAIVRIEGPRVNAYKGDDTNRAAGKITIDESIRLKIQTYCHLKFLVKVQDYGEFCGNVIGPSGIYPNIKRKLTKIMGNRFNNYKHFAEYQQSIRDWVDYVYKIGLSQTVACTVMNSYVDGDRSDRVEQVLDMFYQIDSFGHISEEDFNNKVKEYTVRSYMNVLNSDMEIGFTLLEY